MSAAEWPVKWTTRAGSSRSSVVIPDDPQLTDAYPGVPAVKPGPYQEGNAWSSKVSTVILDEFPFHLPVLDVDVPHFIHRDQRKVMERHIMDTFGQNQQWVSSASHWHVYIGALCGGRHHHVLTWREYERALRRLVDLNIVDDRWAFLSVSQGECVVRKPNHPKPPKVIPTVLNCMWCGKAVTSADRLEEHEDACV